MLATLAAGIAALGLFRSRACKPLRVLPIVGTNRLPTSPAPGHPVTEPIDLDDIEARFQISLETEVRDGVFGDSGKLSVGCTQPWRRRVFGKDFWRQLRAINDEPGVMLVFASEDTLPGWQGRLMCGTLGVCSARARSSGPRSAQESGRVRGRQDPLHAQPPRAGDSPCPCDG